MIKLSEDAESLVFTANKKADLKRDSTKKQKIDVDPILRDSYISFLENIYDDVINVRIRSNNKQNDLK